MTRILPALAVAVALLFGACAAPEQEEAPAPAPTAAPTETPRHEPVERTPPSTKTPEPEPTMDDEPVAEPFVVTACYRILKAMMGVDVEVTNVGKTAKVIRFDVVVRGDDGQKVGSASGTTDGKVKPGETVEVEIEDGAIKWDYRGGYTCEVVKR